MSTDAASPSRAHPTREYREYQRRMGETLTVLVGGRAIEAPLRGVALDREHARTTVALHVETPNGQLTVSPGRVRS